MAPVPAADDFGSTPWSAVFAAAQTASPEARPAMARLCAAYWYPLYAYVRRQGLAQAEAEDLTQEFFARQFLTGSVLKGADPARGRFRAWLLTAIKNLRLNELNRGSTQKRGGSQPHLPLEFFQSAEGRYLEGQTSQLSADQLIELDWAITLLRRVRDQLRSQCTGPEALARYEALSAFLPGADGGSQPETAGRLGLTAEAMRKAVFDLRKRFGNALRTEVCSTLANPAELDEEIRHLMEVCSW